MLVLFMKLKVHLKKCFHNVHKEMAWDVTFVTKKLWKSHCQHCWNTFTNPKPFKTHNRQTWFWHKFFVTKITSQFITLWTLWRYFFKFHKFWNLITLRAFNWKFKHLGLKTSPVCISDWMFLSNMNLRIYRIWKNAFTLFTWVRNLKDVS